MGNHKMYYAVYDNEDNLLMVGNAIECINYTGMKINSFYAHVMRLERGEIKKGNKYRVFRFPIDDEL